MVKVDRSVACKMYNEGKIVIAIPCKLRPNWNFNLRDAFAKGIDFDVICNEIEFYKCDANTGTHLAFYLY